MVILLAFLISLALSGVSLASPANEAAPAPGLSHKLDPRDPFVVAVGQFAVDGIQDTGIPVNFVEVVTASGKATGKDKFEYDLHIGVVDSAEPESFFENKYSAVVLDDKKTGLKLVSFVEIKPPVK